MSVSKVHFCKIDKTSSTSTSFPFLSFHNAVLWLDLGTNNTWVGLNTQNKTTRGALTSFWMHYSGDNK